ncbi:hypothetical protein J2S16_003312 [Cytobacillus kochii]|nr:hypothetical protein [Cytobacillus kochii]
MYVLLSSCSSGINFDNNEVTKKLHFEKRLNQNGVILLNFYVFFIKKIDHFNLLYAANANRNSFNICKPLNGSHQGL